MLNALMDFYTDMYNQYKKEEQLQVIILKYIVELLIISGGENRSNKGNYV